MKSVFKKDSWTDLKNYRLVKVLQVSSISFWMLNENVKAPIGEVKIRESLKQKLFDAVTERDLCWKADRKLSSFARLSNLICFQ